MATLLAVSSVIRNCISLQERLRDIGSWLGVNGEAIYKSQPWVHQNDTSNPNVWYTRDDDMSDPTQKRF